MTLEEARQFFIQDRFAMVTTGIEIDEVGKNYSKCSLKVEERHLAAGDHVMGGAIYTLADFAFAVASNTREQLTMTSTSNISYMGQPKDGQLIAECKCLKDGRRTCFFETEVRDGLGNIVAVVSANGIHVKA